MYVTLAYTPSQVSMLWSEMGHSFRAQGGHLDRFTPVMNITINTLHQSPEWFEYDMSNKPAFNPNAGSTTEGRRMPKNP